MVMERKKPRFFYGYVIVIAAFFVMVMTSGTLYGFGVFVKPLIEEFGWSRALTSGVYSTALLVLGVFFTVTGRLNDKFGPRLVLTVSGIFLGIGYVLMSRVSEVWHLYLIYGGVVAVGQSGSLIPMMSTVARWFTKRRGLMGGIVISGVGVGQAVIPPVATRLIETVGWRNTYLLMGASVGIVLLGLAQFMKRDPGKVGQLPDGAKEIKPAALAAATSGLTFQEAKRSRQLWMVVAIYVCYGFLVQGTMVHLVPHAIDLGISSIVAASVLTFVGISSVVGRIGVGSTGDRIGYRRAIIFGFSVAIAGTIWLQFARDLPGLYLFAILFGFSYGGLVSIESPFVASLFGLKAHGALLGVVHFGATIGGAVSPLVEGRIFDVTGSYQIAFLVVTGVVATGLVLTLLLKAPRKKV